MYFPVIRTVLWPAIFDASMRDPSTSCRHEMLTVQEWGAHTPGLAPVSAISVANVILGILGP